MLLLSVSGWPFLGRGSEGFWVSDVRVDFVARWKNGLTGLKREPRRILVAQRSFLKGVGVPDTHDGV